MENIPNENLVQETNLQTYPLQALSCILIPRTKIKSRGRQNEGPWGDLKGQLIRMGIPYIQYPQNRHNLMLHSGPWKVRHSHKEETFSHFQDLGSATQMGKLSVCHFLGSEHGILPH